MIRREVVDPENEYSLLGMMIMNNDIMSSAYNRYKSGSLKTKHFTGNFRPIFRWLIQYYGDHRKAPKTTISKIFERRKKSLTADNREIVEEYLDRLSEEYEPDTDPEYIRQEVLPDFIRERELDERIQKAQQELDAGQFDRAERTISTYQPITVEDEDANLGTISPFTVEDVEYGFSKENLLKEGFRFSGDLNRLVGPMFHTWLVAVTGTEKAGKSYVLQEIAYEAALYQKKKVLIINLELSEPVARNRLWRRISRTAKKRYAGDVIVPILDCENNQFRTCKVRKRMPKEGLFRGTDDVVTFGMLKKKFKWKTCQKCRNDSSIRKNAARTKRYIPALWFKRSKIREINERVVKQALDNKRLNRLSNLRVKCFPRFTVTFDQTRDFIMRYIDRMKWEPDLIIYDYLDILRPEGGLEGRFAIDDTWKRASGLAGELNSLVFTADQSIKAGRTQYALDQMSTSESKTKDSHLDIHIAINQTDDEKDLGLSRYNVVFHRHEMFNVQREVLVTQRLATANPILDSAFLWERGKKFRVIP